MVAVVMVSFLDRSQYGQAHDRCTTEGMPWAGHGPGTAFDRTRLRVSVPGVVPGRRFAVVTAGRGRPSPTERGRVVLEEDGPGRPRSRERGAGERSRHERCTGDGGVAARRPSGPSPHCTGTGTCWWAVI